jgi:hypothetical protein
MARRNPKDWPIPLSNYRWGRGEHLLRILELKRKIRDFGDIRGDPMMAFGVAHHAEKLDKLRKSLAFLRKQPIREAA